MDSDSFFLDVGGIAALPYLLCMLAGLGIAYQFLAAASAQRIFRHRASPNPNSSESRLRPGVSVIKPVCGDEPQLFRSLETFCTQNYPTFEIVIGAFDNEDPALREAERLKEFHTEVPVTISAPVVKDAFNRKIAILETLTPVAKYEIMIISDSDIQVGTEYIETLVREMTEPGVSAVTCAYRARGIAGAWASIGAMGVNCGFLPSVAFSHRFEIVEGAYGATIALTKDVLRRAGGLAPLRDGIADDFHLGEAIRRTSGGVKLSEMLVETLVTEDSFSALFARELRWARTVRRLAPVGYLFSVISNPVALAAAAVIVSLGDPISVLILSASFAARYLNASRLCNLIGAPAPVAHLLLVRDGLSFIVYIASLFGDSVFWRGRRLRIGKSGTVREVREH